MLTQPTETVGLTVMAMNSNPPCWTAFRSNTKIVRHQIGTPSVMPSEYCPHVSGILSVMVRNVHPLAPRARKGSVGTAYTAPVI